MDMRPMKRTEILPIKPMEMAPTMSTIMMTMGLKITMVPEVKSTNRMESYYVLDAENLILKVDIPATQLTVYKRTTKLRT